jgi:hypothetical protein
MVRCDFVEDGDCLRRRIGCSGHKQRYAYLDGCGPSLHGACHCPEYRHRDLDSREEL